MSALHTTAKPSASSFCGINSMCVACRLLGVANLMSCSVIPLFKYFNIRGKSYIFYEGKLNNHCIYKHYIHGLLTTSWSVSCLTNSAFLFSYGWCRLPYDEEKNCIFEIAFAAHSI